MKTLAEAHWDYFLVLEEDLIELFKYIEPCEDNYRTYGAKIVKLFLSVCSEVENVLKGLTSSVEIAADGPGSMRESIKNLRKLVQGHFASDFCCVEVEFVGSEIRCKPWDAWWNCDARFPSDDNPGWWKAYNAVKHDRVGSYPEANLGNVIYAFAALFVTEAALLRHERDHLLVRPMSLVRFSDSRFGDIETCRFDNGTIHFYSAPRFNATIKPLAEE